MPSKGNIIHGFAARGKSRSKEYQAWDHMKQRCINPKNHAYRNYGGRGIKVCDRWLESFLNFIEDMGLAPHKKLSLDRVDNNGNYEPGNCRWATSAQQSSNRRATNCLEFNGEIKSLAAWSKSLNLNRGTVNRRIRKGWPIEKALSAPSQKVRGIRKPRKLNACNQK